MQNKTTTSLIFLLLSGSASLSSMQILYREKELKSGTFTIKEKKRNFLDKTESWTTITVYERNKITIKQGDDVLSITRDINKTNGDITFTHTELIYVPTLVYNKKNKSIRVLFKDEDPFLFNWQNKIPDFLPTTQKDFFYIATSIDKYFKTVDKAQKQKLITLLILIHTNSKLTQQLSQ